MRLIIDRHAGPFVLAMTGIALLGLGSLVYIFQRPPGTVACLPEALSFASGRVDAGNPWGWLPDLCHAAGFGLLTAVAWGVHRRGAVGVAAAWGGIDAVAECFQHPSLAVLLPPVTHAGGRSGGTSMVLAYFHNGTFDPLDLLAFLAGSALAGSVVAAARRRQPVQ